MEPSPLPPLPQQALSTSPPPARAKGETEAHRALKSLAAQWAWENGMNIMAPEVSFPYARVRADVAAYKPYYKVPAHLRGGIPSAEEEGDEDSAVTEDSGAETGDFGLTAIFECKQSRSDLMKDSHDGGRVAERLRTLVDRKERLEALLRMHCPHLARGESLFPEFDSYSWDSLGHKSHTLVMRKIREAQSALSFKTKFSKMLNQRLAHLHYLVMEPGIIKPHEAPLGWGLLVRVSGGGRNGADSLRLAAPPARVGIRPGMQLLFLQRIAATAGRGLLPPGQWDDDPQAKLARMRQNAEPAMDANASLS